MAHDRADVAPVELHDGQIALPADRIQRIEWIGDRRSLVAPLHLQRPFAVALRLERRVELRRIQRCRIEDRVRPQYAALRQPIAAVRRLDQQGGGGGLGLQPPHRAARQQQIVALAIGEMAEIAEEVAIALMDEQKYVAIGIALQLRHRRLATPQRDPAMGVGKQQRAFVRLGGRRLDRLHGVEGAWPERPLEVRPAGRRMFVIDMRRRPEETVAADLALERAGRQVGMRLARGLALDTREFDPVAAAHATVSFRTPRLI